MRRGSCELCQLAGAMALPSPWALWARVLQSHCSQERASSVPRDPSCTPSALPRQPGHRYSLRSIPVTSPQLCFPVGDPTSGVPREAEQGGDRSGCHTGTHGVPAGHGRGKGGVIRACQLQDPRDPQGLLLLCIFGSGCSHTSLHAFTAGAPAQGNARQDSALETIFSPSSKPQQFLGLLGLVY